MATEYPTITKAWSEIHGTAGTIDISANKGEWFIAIGLSPPASSIEGRKLKNKTIYNVVLTGSNNAYGKTLEGSFQLSKDVT